MPSTSAMACSLPPGVRQVPRSKARTRMSRSDNAGIRSPISRRDDRAGSRVRWQRAPKTPTVPDGHRKAKNCERRCSKLRCVVPFHCLTFLTDYGLEDAFVAVCHGVASQIAPDIQITDITHLIPRGDIRRGALGLAQ